MAAPLRTCVLHSAKKGVFTSVSQVKTCQQVCRRLLASNASIKYSRNYVKLLGTVSLGVAVGTGVAIISGFHNDTLPSVSAATVDNYESKRSKYSFIADVSEKAAPAVVHIEIQGRNPYSGGFATLSNGSGFIVREDGLILTNAHVVANKSQVKVKLQDGRSYPGIVQAVDPVSDLATVKIDAKGLPTLPLGKSSTMRPGEFVIAMGSPFQLSNTVTAGIISSISRGSRELGLHNKDIEYIQTDATINFGNSGGPLINLDGEAIGINTMKVTTGISFAIPSEYAQLFLERAQSIEKRNAKTKSWFGSVRGNKRRYMGISMLTLTPDIIMELRTRLHDQFPNVESGVLVHRIIVGSPAFNGGLQAGDVIVGINDSAVANATDVYKAVEESELLHIKVLRRNQTVLLTVKPEEAA